MRDTSLRGSLEQGFGKGHKGGDGQPAVLAAATPASEARRGGGAHLTNGARHSTALHRAPTEQKVIFEFAVNLFF